MKLVQRFTKPLTNQKGLSELIQYGSLIILTCIIVAGVATLIAPSLDSGMATVTSRITTTFSTISGL